MTNAEIKELIHIVIESGVAELEVQRGDNRVRIRLASNASAHQDIPLGGGTLHVPVQPPNSMPSAAASGPASGVTATVDALVDPKMITVKSPIVGTYYDAPSPGAPPFVRVGDAIRAGQVLCIIESMKLMNEIEAEVSGILAGKLVENGSPVEYGEALFAIRQQ